MYNCIQYIYNIIYIYTHISIIYLSGAHLVEANRRFVAMAIPESRDPLLDILIGSGSCSHEVMYIYVMSTPD